MCASLEYGREQKKIGKWLKWLTHEDDKNVGFTLMLQI